jgi:hypothetical protein
MCVQPRVVVLGCKSLTGTRAWIESLGTTCVMARRSVGTCGALMIEIEPQLSTPFVVWVRLARCDELEDPELHEER